MTRLQKFVEKEANGESPYRTAYVLQSNSLPQAGAEKPLQGKTGEIIERRVDGRITIRFDSGRLLMGRDAVYFEPVGVVGLRRRSDRAFQTMQYPHWLVVIGAILPAVGFIGFVFHKNKNGSPGD
jgi:hypothetical protein